MEASKLYIASEDLKKKYSHVTTGKKRIEKYVEALKFSRKVEIIFNVKENRTVEIIIGGGRDKSKDTSLTRREIREDIQGELCSPEAIKKYKQPPKKVSEKAREEMKIEDQERLQTKHIPTLTIEALEAHDAKHTTGPCELRQFACPICKHYWWRTVLKSKRVSRCRGRRCGNRRYDALPKSKEFGIGRFICPNSRCSRKFFGHCEASELLKCRKCGSLTKPYIHPKWRKRRPNRLNPNTPAFQPRPYMRRSLNQHDLGEQFDSLSLASGNEIPIAYGYETHTQELSQLSDSSADGSFSYHGGSIRQPEIPPRRHHRVFNASQEHQPEGGTMSTFLTQIDFEKEGVEVDLDYDSDDDDEKVGACKFECINESCKNEYTVICRMMDSAECYKCHTYNRPLTWAPPREIESETGNPHSCSRCRGVGKCPNLTEVGK